MSSPYLPTNHKPKELWGQEPFPGWLEDDFILQSPCKISVKEVGGSLPKCKVSQRGVEWGLLRETNLFLGVK